MVKPVVIALLAGAVSALALLTFAVGGPGALVLINLTPLPLMIVGLGLGVVPAGIAGAGGTVIAGLAGSGTLGAIFLGVFAVPVVVMVRQALLRRPAPPAGDAAAGGADEWYPIGSVVSLLAALVAATLVVAVTVGVGHQEDLRQVVSDMLEQALAVLAPTLGDLDQDRMAAIMTPLFPGTVGTSWLLMLVANGALAQGILVKAGRNLRPRTRYVTMTLPDWASWALVAAAAVTLLGSGNLEYMGQNLALILALPFFLLGLAVAHAVARRLPQRGWRWGRSMSSCSCRDGRPWWSSRRD